MTIMMRRGRPAGTNMGGSFLGTPTAGRGPQQQAQMAAARSREGPPHRCLTILLPCPVCPARGCNRVAAVAMCQYVTVRSWSLGRLCLAFQSVANARMQ